MIGSRPKQEFEKGSLVVMSSRKERRVLLIQGAIYHKCSGDRQKKWYYNGVLLNIAKDSKSLSNSIPNASVKYATTIINVSEELIIEVICG